MVAHPSTPDEVYIEGLWYKGIVLLGLSEGARGADGPPFLQTFLGGELVVYGFHLLGNYNTQYKLLDEEYTISIINSKYLKQ